jgi:uroporphyrinogen-III synthase
LVASQAHAMGLLEALGPVAGLSVLLVQGTEARPELADGLRAGGALLQVAHVYQTRPKPPSPEQIASLGRVDLALFASPSALKAFLQAPEAHRLLQSTRLICLGPTTARAAREAGLPVVFVPDQPDPLQALLEAPEEVR